MLRRWTSPASVRYFLLAILVGALSSGEMVRRFPGWNSVHFFVGVTGGIVFWTIITWSRLLVAWIKDKRTRDYVKIEVDSEESGHLGLQLVAPSPARNRRASIPLLCMTALVIYWLWLGMVPNQLSLPLHENTLPFQNSTGGEKVFIAANLYNMAEIWDTWSSQVLALTEVVGESNIFISIYESNSVDNTQHLLAAFDSELAKRQIRHRIFSEKTHRYWRNSAERIHFLQAIRNRALEPIASPDDAERLGNFETWNDGRVVFLNDIVFEWQDVMKLLDARTDDGNVFDLICGMDFDNGLYDLWVTRDACGIPLRYDWPYFKDDDSVQSLIKQRPVSVSTCWNGLAVFPTKYVSFRRRPAEASVFEADSIGDVDLPVSQHIIDKVSPLVDSLHSPPVELPLSFRTSGLPECMHSECFLFGYDLHRIYPTQGRPPRIAMDPRVRVTYDNKWYVFHKRITEIPVIQWWLGLSRWRYGPFFQLRRLVWKHMPWDQDYCTWAGMNRPKRCEGLTASPAAHIWN